MEDECHICIIRLERVTDQWDEGNLLLCSKSKDLLFSIRHPRHSRESKDPTGRRTGIATFGDNIPTVVPTEGAVKNHQRRAAKQA
jgi:hypothetical protein